MTGPKRIQMSRQKPWRPDHPDAIVVARPSKWGNPIRWTDYPSISYDCEGESFAVRASDRRRFAVTDFEAVVRFGIGSLDYPSADEIRAELAGRDLACWCPLPVEGQRDYCHGAVLLLLANAPLVAARTSPPTTAEEA